MNAWFALALLLLSSAALHAEPELVLLVRHAERAAEPATEPTGDPELSAEGRQRAQALATALADAGVTGIVTTQFQRTRQTAAPLAAARGLTPQVVEARRGEDHIATVTAAVRQLNGVVLVVGHSNTVPQIAAALAGSTGKTIDFCETSYSHLLAVHGRHLLRARYGAADVIAPREGCQ